MVKHDKIKRDDMHDLHEHDDEDVFPICLPSLTSMYAVDPRARPPPCMRARRRGAWPWAAQPTHRHRPLPARSWSQPNDLGSNASFKWVVGDEVLTGGETVVVQKETLVFNLALKPVS